MTEISKPAPERGWEILNKVASCAVTDEKKNSFVAKARNLESMFTSGLMSEQRYVGELTYLLFLEES